jgi:hypothetical protein
LGCENVMIQLLVSLIEWFAVVGLSVLGISYEPPRPCINPEPTEFRQTVNWLPADARDAVRVINISSGDCIAGIDTLIHGSTPYFLTPSDRYDS